MFNAKLYGELQAKRTELDAKVQVNQALGEFIIANANRCKSERNFSECHAWLDAMEEANDKLKTIEKEYSKLVKQIKEL